MMLMPRRGFHLFDDDFFNDDFFTEREKNHFSLMKTDIKENDENYLLEVDLPGYQKEDIKIDVHEGYLTIHAKKNEESSDKKENYVRRERFYGECSRSFFVGEDVEVEDIKASFRNGILNLEVPKVDPKKKLDEKKYVEISD